MSELKSNSTPLLNQEYQRKWTYFGSTYLGNDIFYLKEYIDMSMQDYGEEEVKNALITFKGTNEKRLNKIGNGWNHFMKKFREFDEKVTKCKGFYDKIEKKEFTKIDDKDLNNFLRVSKSIPLIKEDLYALAIFFLKNSRIKDHTIKSEEWKILEYSGLKKMDVASKRPVPKIETHEIN